MKRKFSPIKYVARKFKFHYIKLMRSPGGTRKVSRGFAVGFGLEIILPFTLYTGYIFLIPLVYLFRTSLTTALIGNVICKITFLPLVLVPLGHWIGRHIPFRRPDFMPVAIYKYIKTLIGLSITAVIVGSVAYLIIFYLLEKNKSRKKKLHATN
ncbi:DUF2062 domain-containing protein [Paenibacillus terrigena]|uniref:DUF2062 domain-containing protein n=1 Tax=Paenibacillus terrigena TaxID=369333 RepID=UPI0028D02DEC|nr:DUF2062 domain-containing protein [Paenibacillus terrigena]